MSALRYHPVRDDAVEMLADASPACVLWLGTTVGDCFDSVQEVRLSDGPGAELPQGVYHFARGAEIWMMVVESGTSPDDPISTEWDSHDSAALMNAFGWFEHWWAEADQIPHPVFAIKSEVLTPEDLVGHVDKRAFVPGHQTWLYTVRAGGRATQIAESRLRQPTSDDGPAEWITRPASSHDRFAATLTRAKLREQLTDTVFSFRASRTLFRAYQFRPIIRLLETNRLRLLIADEVGLGKTIEAGLVWTELEARSAANRVLIVCPSSLVPKWQHEMRDRFDFELQHLRAEGLDQLLDRAENDRSHQRLQAVCSIEGMRGWPGLERLAELAPNFDLIVVDEAHAFRNSDTKSHALGSLLSDWADALVFLSATPLNLGNRDLYNLISLLTPGEFQDLHVFEQLLEPNGVLHEVQSTMLNGAVENSERLCILDKLHELPFGAAVTKRPEFAALVDLFERPSFSPADAAEAKRRLASLHTLSASVTRTRKIDIEEHKAIREAREIHVTWADEEVDFYEAIKDWRVARAKEMNYPVGFVTQMPLRLASSCLQASKRRYLDAFDAAQDTPDDPGEMTDEDHQTLEEQPPDEVIAAAAALGDTDTKFDEFLPNLLDVVAQGRQVIIFTTFRRTIGYLLERLSPHIKVAVLHGDIAHEQRPKTIADFRAGDYDVLVANRVVSEGLDFEFCSAIVNYDLPWNPMEVEQRIGRIDRFGQTAEKIQIWNFVTPGTIESDIVLRLHRRIGVFENSIGALEPVLQSEVKNLRKQMFDFSLSDHDRNHQVEQTLQALESQRQAVDEVEAAAAYLSSTDNADIAGLEKDLESQGRYVGPNELVLLLDDWLLRYSGARCRVVNKGQQLVVSGTADLIPDLDRVRSEGERSTEEIQQLIRNLRYEHDITLYLDQELARTTNGPLLTSSHPLVKAAMLVPSTVEERYASVKLTSPEISPGSYFCLLAIAKWTGVQPSTELWVESVDLASGAMVSAEIGHRFMASLAEGSLRAGPDDERDLAPFLASAFQAMAIRQLDEDTRRASENESLLTTRRISLEETHKRKLAQIEERIATIRRKSDNQSVLRMHQGQLKAQEERLRSRLAELGDLRGGGLEVEPIAVCRVEVVQ